MGRIAAPHGVQGAVKVRPGSADPASLLDHRTWWLRSLPEGTWSPRRVLAARAHGAMMVAELDGIATRDAASALRGVEVGVPRESLPPLAAGEHYQSDLIGMMVVNREGIALGRVAGFVESGAHPIVRIAADGGIERLIPWVASHIDGIDVAARRIDVDWPAEY